MAHSACCALFTRVKITRTNKITLKEVSTSHESQQIKAMLKLTLTHTHTHTCLTALCLSGTTRVSRYQKGKTSLDFTEARDSEWQWHQLGHMQVSTSLQMDSHARTSSLILQAGCPSCRPTNSIKALKEITETD